MEGLVVLCHSSMGFVILYPDKTQRLLEMMVYHGLPEENGFPAAYVPLPSVFQGVYQVKWFNMN